MCSATTAAAHALAGEPAWTVLLAVVLVARKIRRAIHPIQGDMTATPLWGGVTRAGVEDVYIMNEFFVEQFY
jgi:MYXO-CTERM domain-containing protein